MKNTAIIYSSIHHGNTKKLIDAIVKAYPEITLIDSSKVILKDLAKFDLIGFASGIYFKRFHKSIMSFITDNLPEYKKTFLMFTCGSFADSYTEEISRLIRSKKCTVEGYYGCYGFDTFGPFKLIGGLQKGHPDDEEIRNAVEFAGKMIEGK